MIWVYLSWLILLIGASIAYYHQNPEQLRGGDLKIHLSARMHEQLTLQLMLNIARSQDRSSNIETSVENLARQHKVPADYLQRVLNNLEANDLLRRANDKTLSYLPSRPATLIRLIDIINCSRAAEEFDSGGSIKCDQSISNLLNDIESRYESVLGELTLADLLVQNIEGKNDENSFV